MNHFRLPFIFIILILSNILFIHNAQAQSVQVGITGGVNMSSHLKDFWLKNNDGTDIRLNPKITTGFQTGFLARKDFSQVLRLQTEPSLILLGARYQESFQSGNLQFHTKSRTKLLYVQLPLVLQISTIPKRRTVYGEPFATTTVHLTGGVFGGYLLDANFDGKNTNATDNFTFQGSFSEDVTSRYTDYDGGVIFGGGIEYGNKGKVGFETRAIFSVFDTGNSSDQYWFHPQNMAITFSLYFIL